MLTTLLVLLTIQFGLCIVCAFVMNRKQKATKRLRKVSETLSNEAAFFEKLRLMDGEYARETVKFLE